MVTNPTKCIRFVSILELLGIAPSIDSDRWPCFDVRCDATCPLWEW